MQFLLGPAGSGKTFRCLTEVRRELLKSADTGTLLFIAPRQATYQIERRLLSDPEIDGYTRLHVLSFQRLAGFVFDHLQKARPRILTDEGKVMVLRALLARHRDQLKVFRASGRMAGFSAQLSSVFEEFQQNQLTPAVLEELAGRLGSVEGLNWKLLDLAAMLRFYTEWLQTHDLKDANFLLQSATEELRRSSKVSPEDRRDRNEVRTRLCALQNIWVDGFHDFAAQELELLLALGAHCQQMTITFCLERKPQKTKSSWLSCWSAVENAFLRCRKHFEEVADAKIDLEVIDRSGPNRFVKSGPLHHLEKHWDDPRPYTPSASEICPRIISCPNPDAEAVVAAREILRHVRGGGRYRDVAVLVRNLSAYQPALRRVFTRYGIPFFVDRREPVSHHPAVELTRSALRTVALGWLHEDFFAALKTGLVPMREQSLDQFENEALARGWVGENLKDPTGATTDPELVRWLTPLMEDIGPFRDLESELAAVANRPNGLQLSRILRNFWSRLEVEQQLNGWAAAGLAARTVNLPATVHSTVWEGLNSLLENIELAFGEEPLPIRDWLPILEAAYANFSVGVIPPALDQVLVGTVDRSRDAEIKAAVVLGVNETVFPALPERDSLLTDTERTELERQNALMGGSVQMQLGRERFFAYLAFTRPAERLILTCASEDAEGSSLNQSPFIAQIQKLFPSVVVEQFDLASVECEPEHATELVTPLLKAGVVEAHSANERLLALAALPGLEGIVQEISQMKLAADRALTSETARRLYGKVLRTSVSRIEQFAQCPFRFFVHSGLKAQERKRFEIDTREQGNFQHETLARFHAELQEAGLRWRDLSPDQARQRIGSIGTKLLLTYRDGLFQTSERNRFMGGTLVLALQDFIETLVGWMREQYRFDPVAVELPFGESEGLPAYGVDIGNGTGLAFKGRIDRIDLLREPGKEEAWCVVVDYKSSQKQLDPLLLEHGIQLQLVTYLNVLRAIKQKKKVFGVERLIPAGVFYVSLRGKFPRKQTRDEALEDTMEDREEAYQHTGRFDFAALRYLDARPGAVSGTQFNYRLKKDGQPYGNANEVMDSTLFAALLDGAEANLKNMAAAVFSGAAAVSPYKKGKQTACDYCEYHSICRVDPWTQDYRVLRPAENK